LSLTHLKLIKLNIRNTPQAKNADHVCFIKAPQDQLMDLAAYFQENMCLVMAGALDTPKNLNFQNASL
jgi:hypothetical protein